MSEIKETFLLEILKMTDEEIIDFIFWCCARDQVICED